MYVLFINLMNLFMIAMFFISFMMVGLMAGLMIQQAHADYFEAINMRYHDNPMTCIFEPEYDEDYFNSHHFTAVYEGVKEWETTMTEATDGDWYIPMTLYEWELHVDKEVHDFMNCDILITFEERNDATVVGAGALGYNHYNHSWSKHKYSHIVIFTYTIDRESLNINIGEITDGEKIEIVIEPKRLDNADMLHIVKHEWGHAVGLLHHFNTDGSSEIRSVMHPHFEPFTDFYLEIQPRDIYGIVQLYGEDGWSHPNPAHIDKNFQSLDWFIPKIDIEDVRVRLI